MPPKPLHPGAQFPTILVRLASGGLTDLAFVSEGFEHKLIVVTRYAGCAFCASVISHLDANAHKFAAASIEVVIVWADDEAATLAYMAERGIKHLTMACGLAEPQMRAMGAWWGGCPPRRAAAHARVCTRAATRRTRACTAAHAQPPPPVRHAPHPLLTCPAPRPSNPPTHRAATYPAGVFVSPPESSHLPRSGAFSEPAYFVLDRTGEVRYECLSSHPMGGRPNVEALLMGLAYVRDNAAANPDAELVTWGSA